MHSAAKTASRRAMPPSSKTTAPKDANLLVRFDSRTKAIVGRAATFRGLSVSDYVRSRIVPLAERDVEEATTGVLRLSREDQTALWQALQHPRKVTRAQQALGRLVRSVR